MSEYIYERPDEPAKVVRDGWNVRIEWGFVQREPIVRCRDCMWFHWDDSGRWCAQSLVRRSDPDGFCAWAERRAD